MLCAERLEIRAGDTIGLDFAVVLNCTAVFDVMLELSSRLLHLTFIDDDVRLDTEPSQKHRSEATVIYDISTFHPPYPVPSRPRLFARTV
jgi:hypothetical protein